MFEFGDGLGDGWQMDHSRNRWETHQDGGEFHDWVGKLSIVV